MPTKTPALGKVLLFILTFPLSLIVLLSYIGTKMALEDYADDKRKAQLKGRSENPPRKRLNKGHRIASD